MIRIEDSIDKSTTIEYMKKNSNITIINNIKELEYSKKDVKGIGSQLVNRSQVFNHFEYEYQEQDEDDDGVNSDQSSHIEDICDNQNDEKNFKRIQENQLDNGSKTTFIHQNVKKNIANPKIFHQDFQQQFNSRTHKSIDRANNNFLMTSEAVNPNFGTSKMMNETILQNIEATNTAQYRNIINKEDRIRMVREKRDAEIEKRKREIEENLRRKSELRDRQLKERQKRIDEIKQRESERRARVEERRRQRDELIRIKLNELVKREQERMNLVRTQQIRASTFAQTTSKINSEATKKLQQHEINITGTNFSLANTHGINKSQSAFNLASSKRHEVNHLSITNNDQPQTQQHHSTSTLVSLSSFNVQSKNVNVKKLNRNQNYSTGSSKLTDLSTARNSKTESFISPSMRVDESSRINTITQKRKKHPVQSTTSLSPNMQSFVNRLSIPKNKELIVNHDALSTSMSVACSQRRSSTPQALLTTTAGDIVLVRPDARHCLTNSTNVGSSGISSAASSAVSIVKKTKKLEMANKLNKPIKSLPAAKEIDKLTLFKSDSEKVNNESQTFKQNKKIHQSMSMNTIGKSINKTNDQKMNEINSLSANNLSNVDTVVLTLTSTHIQNINSNDSNTLNTKQIKDHQNQLNTQIAVENSLSDICSDTVDETYITTNLVKSNKSEEEEAYKKRLEEKRKEVREKVAREERAERLEEERRRREEEEAEQRAAEEEERLNQLARELEEQRIRDAIELNQRLETERKMREESERKMKEESERKAREESDRIERERLEKLRKDEEERLERKKKIDAIMKRVHREESAANSLNTSSSNFNLNNGMSTSNTDLSSTSPTMPNSMNFMNNEIVNSPVNSSVNKIMTTSITNTSNTTESSNNTTFKAPLLQSILSKTRLNSILNKYDVGQSLAAAAAVVTTNTNNSIIGCETNQASDDLKKSELEEVRIEVDDVNKYDNKMLASSPSTSSSSSAAASPKITSPNAATKKSPSTPSSPQTTTNSTTLVA